MYITNACRTVRLNEVAGKPKGGVDPSEIKTSLEAEAKIMAKQMSHIIDIMNDMAGDVPKKNPSTNVWAPSINAVGKILDNLEDNADFFKTAIRRLPSRSSFKESTEETETEINEVSGDMKARYLKAAIEQLQWFAGSDEHFGISDREQQVWDKRIAAVNKLIDKLTARPKKP